MELVLDLVIELAFQLKFGVLGAPPKMFASPTEPNSWKIASSKYEGTSRETISKSAWSTAVSVASDGEKAWHVSTWTRETLDVSIEQTITDYVAPANIRMLSIGRQHSKSTWSHNCKARCRTLLVYTLDPPRFSSFHNLASFSENQ